LEAVWQEAPWVPPPLLELLLLALPLLLPELLPLLEP
jgi:hypothetical protein